MDLKKRTFDPPDIKTEMAIVRYYFANPLPRRKRKARPR